MQIIFYVETNLKAIGMNLMMSLPGKSYLCSVNSLYVVICFIMVLDLGLVNFGCSNDIYTM